MTKQILISRAGRGAYGNEYKATYIKDGKVLYSEVMFANDVKSADSAFTKEFQGVKVQRVYGKAYRKKMKRL